MLGGINQESEHTKQHTAALTQFIFALLLSLSQY